LEDIQIKAGIKAKIINMIQQASSLQLQKIKNILFKTVMEMLYIAIHLIALHLGLGMTCVFAIMLNQAKEVQHHQEMLITFLLIQT
jgi:hypothetical protein